MPIGIRIPGVIEDRIRQRRVAAGHVSWAASKLKKAQAKLGRAEWRCSFAEVRFKVMDTEICESLLSQSGFAGHLVKSGSQLFVIENIAILDGDIFAAVGKPVNKDGSLSKQWPLWPCRAPLSDLEDLGEWPGRLTRKRIREILASH